MDKKDGMRYFIVVFRHSRGVGNISLSTENGKYLNYEAVANIIGKAFPGIQAPITMINIIELCEEDHAEWIRRRKIVKPDLKLVN